MDLASGSPELSPRPRTVVLVHGIWDSSKIFEPMIRFLSGHGFSAIAPDLLPSNGAVSLEQLAEQIAAFVETSIPPGEPFDLVGFSMGGLVGRYYVQRLGGIERVGRFITLSTPHRGTLWALTAFNPGSRQMRPGSSFLADLNSDAQLLERVRFASVWTPLDLMIVPANSSRLGVGAEFTVPVALHAWVPKSRRCMALIAELLLESPAAS